MEAARNDPNLKIKFSWVHQSTSFMQTIQDVYRNKCFADITLVCEGKTIKAHRIVLKAYTDFFNNVLKAYQYIGHPIIHLDNARFEDLEDLVYFMYHGEMHAPMERLDQIFDLGRELGIKCLTEAIETFEYLGIPVIGNGDQEEPLPNIDENVQQNDDSSDDDLSTASTNNVSDENASENKEATAAEPTNSSNKRKLNSDEDDEPKKKAKETESTPEGDA